MKKITKRVHRGIGPIRFWALSCVRDMAVLDVGELCKLMVNHLIILYMIYIYIDNYNTHYITIPLKEKNNISNDISKNNIYICIYIW